VDIPLLLTRVVVLDANGIGVDSQSGAVLLVDGLSAGPSVDVTWIGADGNDAGTVKAVLIGRTLHAGGQFYGYRLQGTPGAVVTLMIGPTGADAYNMLTTSVVIGHVLVDNEIEIKNDAGNPLPVSGPLTDTQLRAAPVPVTSAGTLGGALTNVAPVACTDVIAAALAASATRRAFYARNLGPNNVALVAAAGTFANAAIVLLPGETWSEKLAPGAAWYAICDAAETATLNILTVT
jgi:hypothetical protein